MSTTTSRHDSIWITDFLFYFQVIGSVVFIASQLSTMRVSIDGISLTWFGFWFVFLSINLILSFQSMRAMRTRLSTQTFIIYCIWSASMGLVLVALLLFGGRWTAFDTVTSLITLFGILCSIGVAKFKKIPVIDPLVQASFAVFCKGVPQLTLALMIMLHGGSGLSPYVVGLGHMTITMRLTQVWYASLSEGWDRYKVGIVIGESANFGTWIVVTIVWFLF